WNAFFSLGLPLTGGTVSYRYPIGVVLIGYKFVAREVSAQVRPFQVLVKQLTVFVPRPFEVIDEGGVFHDFFFQITEKCNRVGIINSLQSRDGNFLLFFFFVALALTMLDSANGG